MEDTMQKIVNLAKQRGFVFPGSEIYGGLANSWDYGPLGTALKNNLRDAWWKYFVTKRTDMVGMDSAVIMNPKVWESSGHTTSFNDAMVDCKQCKRRLRADHLIEDAVEDAKVEGLEPKELSTLIDQHQIPCPHCGSKDFTEARTFNLLFKTSIGKLEDDRDAVYLRGEIAQGMFVNFANVVQSMRMRLPFGIAQVGKAFRNEITPGNFIFRTLEFDLMEFEYFIREENWEEQFDYWLEEMKKFADMIGLDMKRVRVREHTQEELSHYSKRTVDLEFETPFGWKEMFGLAYRTDFDLRNHAEQSGKDLRYTDPESGDKFFPHVVEPTFGLTRLLLMTLLSAYDEEEVESAKGEKETRTVLRFKPEIAPVKIAVLPLSKKEELSSKAKELHEMLGQKWDTMYDETQSIGRRYRRQDEIGTPYCVTFDFDSLEDQAVTVRDRDSMKQERIAIADLVEYFENKF
jgi:glycyl-tRNA synthetase